MANSAAGFGTGEIGYGPSGVDVPQPIGNPEDQFVEDIHQIRMRYVDGSGNLRVPLQLATNGGIRQDTTGQTVNSIILTGVTGVINGYLSDQSSNFGKAAALPDFVVSAGVVPATIQ